MNSGLPLASSTLPPNALVVSYQYVDRPSAAANGMLSGYSTTPLALICFRSFVYSSIVVGIVVIPALVNRSVLTVVTMYDESYGTPMTCPSSVNEPNCGMSVLSAAVSR